MYMGINHCMSASDIQCVILCLGLVKILDELVSFRILIIRPLFLVSKKKSSFSIEIAYTQNTERFSNELNSVGVSITRAYRQPRQQEWKYNNLPQIPQ